MCHTIRNDIFTPRVTHYKPHNPVSLKMRKATRCTVVLKLYLIYDQKSRSQYRTINQKSKIGLHLIVHIIYANNIYMK